MIVSHDAYLFDARPLSSHGAISKTIDQGDNWAAVAGLGASIATPVIRLGILTPIELDDQHGTMTVVLEHSRDANFQDPQRIALAVLDAKSLAETGHHNYRTPKSLRRFWRIALVAAKGAGIVSGIVNAVRLDLAATQDDLGFSPAVSH